MKLDLEVLKMKCAPDGTGLVVGLTVEEDRALIDELAETQKALDVAHALLRHRTALFNERCREARAALAAFETDTAAAEDGATETDEQKRARRGQLTRARDQAHQLVRAKTFDDAGELINEALRTGAHNGSLACRLFAEANDIRAQIALDSQDDP